MLHPTLKAEYTPCHSRFQYAGSFFPESNVKITCNDTERHDKFTDFLSINCLFYSIIRVFSLRFRLDYNPITIRLFVCLRNLYMASYPSALFTALACVGLQLFPSGTLCRAAAASLTPSGAPAPTLRTLDQIEPRTPISEACTITQPGSYYLTGNIAATTYGITIRTNNVTLDLMGYTLSGDRGSSDYGIWVDGSTGIRRGVCIRNGTVSAFGYGIRLSNVSGCRVEDVVCTTNSNYGIYLRGDSSGICKDNTLRRCVAADNGYGIVLGATSSGVCEGNRILDCIAERNGAYGILLNGNGGSCSFNEIRSTVIRRNGNNGVLLDGSASGFCNGNTLRNCSISDNAQNGLDMQATSQGTCSGNRILNCNLQKNSLYGINVNYASENCFIGNTLTTSGTANLYTANSSGNYILQNVASGSAANYLVNINQVYGPLVPTTGALPTSGDAAHPWANFLR